VGGNDVTRHMKALVEVVMVAGTGAGKVLPRQIGQRLATARETVHLTGDRERVRKGISGIKLKGKVRKDGSRGVSKVD